MSYEIIIKNIQNGVLHLSYNVELLNDCANNVKIYQQDTFNINEKIHKYNIQYLRMAKIWADNSFALRNKVGSLMVKDGTIISDGFNGMPKNFPNSCETNNVTNFEVLHAEANCITKVAKSNNSSDRAILYCTLSPCIECAKLIIQSGIKEFVFCELYRNSEGLDLLCKSGIIIRYYNLNLL